MKKEELINEIKKLKEEKNAVILVHNYQRPEIYEVADFIGDSLGLAQQAAKTDKDIIVFCGVHFMAETAKMLNPKKTVLLPAKDAGCPMADLITRYDVIELKKKHQKAAVACYINTTAEVKAECDICVTSSNAAKVVNSLEEKEVIFLPDKNLAHSISKNTDKKIIAFNGGCYVHQQFSEKELKETKKKYPNAPVIVHPECNPELVDRADVVCSTSAMIAESRKSASKDIIIGTEMGMLEMLKLRIPEKDFHSIGARKACFNMKKTTLKHVYEALKENKHIIEVPEDTAAKARLSVERMLAVK